MLASSDVVVDPARTFSPIQKTLHVGFDSRGIAQLYQRFTMLNSRQCSSFSAIVYGVVQSKHNSSW